MSISTSFLIAGSGGLVINDDQIDVATSMEIAGDGSLSLTDFSMLRTYPYVWPMESPIFFPQLGWEIRKTKDPRYNTVTPKEVDGTTAGTWSAQEGMVMPQNEYDAALYLDIGEFWYEKAHLLPRLLDLGIIAASQSIDAELYNADRANPITVVGVVNNLGLGTTLSGLPALPFDVESQHSVTFTIEVGAWGQLSVDGTLGFELSGGRVIALVATGQRIMLIPIRPEAPLREHLMFDTKILTRVDGSEVRIANRNTPRRMFEGTIASDRQRMEFLLFDRQSKMCAMPAWAEPAYVATAIAAGDDTITVNTTELSGFYENGYVVIFKDANHFDAVQIHTMTDTTLTFKTNILNDYATGIQVMPMLLGYFEANVPAQKALVNDQTFSIKFTVNAEDNDISSTAGWSTYSGKVLLDDPNMADEDGLSETFEDNIIVLDGTTGLMSQLSLWDKNKRNSKKGFKTDTREELWALKKLLYALKGQQVSFYIPTYSNDLTPLETLLNGDNSMTIERIGYTVNVRQRAPKAVIRVVLKSGTTVVRTITDSAIIDNETEELTVNTPWPSDIQPADIERIEFLEKVRISVDDIVIVHYNAIGVSKTIVPIKEVFD